MDVGMGVGQQDNHWDCAQITTKITHTMSDEVIGNISDEITDREHG